MTEAEREQARAKAARNLMNIDDAERRRRVVFGSVLLVRTGYCESCCMCSLVLSHVLHRILYPTSNGEHACR